MYGVAADREIYRALRAGDVGFFCDLARSLSDVLLAGKYANVVGDAVEWYNPSHDVARMVIDAAVRIANGRGGRISNYSFPLVGDPRLPPPGSQPDSLAATLDGATLQAKIETARAYARGSADALVTEVDDAIARFGIEAFGAERLFAAAGPIALEPGTERPFYETYGERQVAAGLYTSVLRWEDHVRPVEIALRHIA